MVRHLAQSAVLGASNLYDEQESNENATAFTIWNLKKDITGTKKWSRTGMGTATGLAMERCIAPNGKPIEPISEPPRPVVHVAVNEYPPFVYKDDPSETEECLGRFVPCYEYSQRDYLADSTPNKFCCFGISIDFLSLLQQDLNFDADIYFAPDGQFGIVNDSDGSWNGIVEELITGKATLSLEMGMNKRRAEVISFAHPTLLLELGILVNKNPREGTKLWFFSHSFFISFS